MCLFKWTKTSKNESKTSKIYINIKYYHDIIKIRFLYKQEKPKNVAN